MITSDLQRVFPYDHSVIWQVFQFCQGICDENLQIEFKMTSEAPNFNPIDAQWSRIVGFHRKTSIFDNLNDFCWIHFRACQIIEIQYSTSFEP